MVRCWISSFAGKAITLYKSACAAKSVYDINRFMDANELNRLRFVAANFKQIQGLRMVAFGVFFLLVFFPWRRQGDLTVSGILLLPAIAGLIFALRRIGNWYERRFGHIEHRSSVTSPLVLWGLVLILLPVLLHPGSLKSISAYMYDFNVEWWFGCVFASAAAASRARWYYLPFGLASMALGVWKSSGGDIQINQGIDGLWAVLAGVAFIATGLADHLLLLRVLPGVRREQIG